MKKCPEDWSHRNAIDPDALKRLEGLLQATGALIVVSSVWRKRLDIPKIQTLLRRKGLGRDLSLRIIGATCDLQENRCRGKEIDTWLRLTGCTDFIILDDSLVELHTDRLVRVNGEVGLQDIDIAEALSLFRNPPTDHEARP
jgi:hypothetical protein